MILENEDNAVLLVTKTIEADTAVKYVQFLVDIFTFQPISKVYSSLREKQIAVQSKKAVESIIQDDSLYMRVLESYFYEGTLSLSQEDNGMLLTKIQ